MRLEQIDPIDPVVIPDNLDDTKDNNKILLNNSKYFNRILIQDNVRLKQILNMVIRHFVIKDACQIKPDCVMVKYLKDSEDIPPQCDSCIVETLYGLRGK